MVSLAEAASVCAHGVQDVFRWSAHPFDKDLSGDQVINSQLVGEHEVTPVLDAHGLQDSRVWPNVFLLPQFSQTVLTDERIGSGVLSREVLMEEQRRDSVLSRVIFFVERGRRPSRRERLEEPVVAIKLLRSWDKLTLRDGVLFRVAKNTLTKRKTCRYVVPYIIVAQSVAGCP